jgi:pimeloyl-ACP methyl ester carboxylesterase
MINYPHAYYLRFFQQRGLNIVLWNYSGYGRTFHKGVCGCLKNYPSPENIMKDSESVLRYAKKQLGLRGKIAIYGRSLGGIAAAHLAP